MFICKICNKKFEKKYSYIGHCSVHNRTETYKIGRKKSIDIKIIQCKYCGKKFDFGKQLCGHSVFCKEHPKYNENRNWIKGRTKNNDKRVVKMSRSIRLTVNKKIKEGTWHNSFSKARSHEYNGKMYYGKWELNYAKYLDNTIGPDKWKKNIDKFYYYFNEDKKWHYYTPDFYLIETKEYVEIKGYETDKDRTKWKQFPKELKLKVLKGKELFELNLIKSYKKDKVV